MSIDWSKCPEATHFDPVDQNFLREIDESLLLFNKIRGWTVPIYTQYGVTIKDCHRPLIKRPEWTGEGLPPVGMVCEYKHVHEWQKVEVFAIKPNHNGSHTALVTYENGTWCGCAEPSFFRPIRTSEQIAEEEREAGVDGIRQAVSKSPNCKAHGLEWDVACAIYDAGYRKQPAP